MKRALIGLLLGCFMTMGLSAVALAGGDNARAAISVHITPMVTKLPCNSQPVRPRYTMVTETTCYDPNGYSIWILVCNASDSTGIAGMEFGINYDGDLASGIDVDSWNLCADLEFPEGDGPGGPAAIGPTPAPAPSSPGTVWSTARTPSPSRTCRTRSSPSPAS